MTGSRWRTPAAGVVSGLLFALAFPPHGWTVLVPLALVPWIVALATEPGRLRALMSGVLFGLAFWCASIPWIFYVVTNYGGQSPLMGIVCVAILALILAEWSAIVGWGAVAVAPAGSARRFVAFSILWAAAEHARSILYGGFPWNLTGWALARKPVWIQSASVWGVYGLGFAAAIVASLLAAAVVRRRASLAVTAAGVVLAAGLFGALRLSRPLPAAPELRVALIQPNLMEEDRRTPEGAARSYENVVARGLEAAASGTDLIVFPESAFPLYWERSARLRSDLTRVSLACNCPVLFNDVTTDARGRYANAARIVAPSGVSGETYRKVHLVPFGEYVPLPRLFFFVRQISQEIGEFSAADEPVVLHSGPLALGVGICYEIIYPPLARRQTADGANLLATISNDSWYGKAGAQEQHFAGAVLRSVENGRDLVRAAITGISGIVDSRGRIAGEIPPGHAGILRGTVRLRSEKTAWTGWAGGTPFAADGAAAAVLVSGLARWWRGRAAARASRRPDAHGEPA